LKSCTNRTKTLFGKDETFAEIIVGEQVSFAKKDEHGPISPRKVY